MVESNLIYLRDLGCRFKGLIHVGANDGAEVDWYFANGCTRVICFEPHPDAVQRAVARHRDRQGLSYIQCALGEEAGSLEFFIPADGDDEKTSRYKPIPTLGHDWTKVPTGASITVPVVRFDDWAARNKLDINDYNTLVIDAQGMELEVLRGFGYYLSVFDYLCIELSHTPVYAGEASAAAVSQYLASQNFHQVSDVKEHDDVMFIRTGALRLAQ